MTKTQVKRNLDGNRGGKSGRIEGKSRYSRRGILRRKENSEGKETKGKERKERVIRGKTRAANAERVGGIRVHGTRAESRVSRSYQVSSHFSSWNSESKHKKKKFKN
jgi:hypothetical protein